jgi:hypothetical protein
MDLAGNGLMERLTERVRPWIEAAIGLHAMKERVAWELTFVVGQVRKARCR